MVATVILAAGEAKRFGSPKQLAMLQGQSLITRVLRAAIEAAGGDVLVVVGAHRDRIVDEIGFNPAVRIVTNRQWSEGRASSLRAGLQAALDSRPTLSAVLFLACDQPHVDAGLLRQMINRHEAVPDAIVACEYAGTSGIPMLLPRRYFAELFALTGEQGARIVAAMHAEDVERVGFPKGATDIDAPADLEIWQRAEE